MSNYAGEEINNRRVLNDILDIFNYPNIDEGTGLAEGTTDGTITEEAYTMNSSEVKVAIKDNASQESLLEINYSKNNQPNFTIIYKRKIYKYNDFKLASKTEYYVEGNPDEWILDEELLKDGIVKIIEYKGNGEVDKDNPEVYNLTIPNMIDGKVVSAVDMPGTKNLEKINGTLTFSAGLNSPLIRDKYKINIKKIIIKENITNPSVQTASDVTDIYISSGCTVGSIIPQTNLVNIIIEDNVNFLGTRTFRNCSNLTEESLTEILKKANNYTSEMFYQIAFPEDFRINFPEKVEITASNLFYFKNNSTIEEINIKDNSKVDSSVRVFNTQAGVTIKNLNIGMNCEVQKLFDYITSTANPTINKVSIGENTIVKAGGHCFYPAVIKEIDIADNVTLEKYSFHTCTDIERITLGKNVIMVVDAISHCTFADGAIVEMYLTDEQKADNTKIVKPDFINDTFTETIGSEKVTWTKN